MQLRKFITRSTRLDDEDYSSHGVSHPSTKLTETMQPAYSSRLRAVRSSKTPSLAAFPSRSLTQTPLEPQKLHYQSPSRSEQNVDDSEERVSVSPPDHCTTSDVASDAAHFDLEDNIDEIETSPQKLDVQTALLPIEWNMLDEGLQMYIFDSLLSRYQQSDIVARMLGSSTADLKNLLYLRNLRATHPLNTEQLWHHCLALSEGNHNFVEPQILGQYMTYFTFAEAFEAASIYQRQLAKAFLNQRGIRGPWVDALLHDQTGIWKRPVGSTAALPDQSRIGNDEVQTLTENQQTIGDDKVRWRSALQNVHIHLSHVVDEMAPYFTTLYFPASLRDKLLDKAVTALNPLEHWLIYGQPSAGLDDVQPFTESSSNDLSNAAAGPPHPILHFLRALFEEYIARLNVPRQIMERRSMLPLYIYGVTRVLAQTRFIKKDIEDTPFPKDQKLRMLEATELRCRLNLLRDIQSKRPHRASAISRPRLSRLASVESSTLVDDEAMQSTGGTSSEPESSPMSTIQPLEISALKTMPLSHDYSADNLHSDIDFPLRIGKRRSDTLSTHGTILMSDPIRCQPRLVESSFQICRMTAAGPWQDHHRSASADTLHTARDDDNDIVMTTPLRRSIPTGRKSPNPPPWSPISDADIASEVPHDAAASEKQKAMRTSFSFPSGLLPSRSTPWLSSKAMRKLSLTLSHRRSSEITCGEEAELRCSGSTVSTEPCKPPHEKPLVGKALHPEPHKVANIPSSSLAPLTRNQDGHHPSAGSLTARLPDTSSSHSPGVEQHAEPMQPSLNLESSIANRMTRTSPSNTPNKQAFFPTFDVQIPSSRPIVPPTSTIAKSKKAKERTAKPPIAQTRPVKSRPTPKLMAKLLPQEVNRPTSPRKDKGQKRGTYMTKKRLAEAATKAGEVYEATKRVNTGTF